MFSIKTFVRWGSCGGLTTGLGPGSRRCAKRTDSMLLAAFFNDCTSFVSMSPMMCRTMSLGALRLPLHWLFRHLPTTGWSHDLQKNQKLGNTSYYYWQHLLRMVAPPPQQQLPLCQLLFQLMFQCRVIRLDTYMFVCRFR